MAYLEGVMVGICLAFGRKKSLPATFQCSLGQLINGAAVRESSTFLPPWPLRISAQVRRDYAETDESSGGRKPGTDIHEGALRGSKRNPYRSLSETASRPETFPARNNLVSECLGQMGFPCKNIHRALLSKIPVFSEKSFLTPIPKVRLTGQNTGGKL